MDLMRGADGRNGYATRYQPPQPIRLAPPLAWGLMLNKTSLPFALEFVLGGRCGYQPRLFGG
jgi:hypothetical protein